jgi:peroxiredoxin
LVVVFTCNHCPFAKSYQERIIALQRDYKDKGVQLVAINPNNEQAYPSDSFEKMKKRAKAKGYNFPYLRDRTQAAALAYGASVTPDVFVFDQERKLRYRGRIDDAPWKPKNVKHRDVRNAILRLLEGKTVEKAVTTPLGCSIKWRNPKEEPPVHYRVYEKPENVNPPEKDDRIPNAIVANKTDKAVWLHDYFAGSRTVFIVYRGGWCPICTRHLSDLMTVYPELKENGWQIVAISPDISANVREVQQDEDISYTVLVDASLEAILRMNLGFELDQKNTDKYRNEYGFPLRKLPGEESVVMPVPAVFLVDSKAKIRFSFFDPDYSNRLSADKILKAVEEMH